jgi:hypothetical protein
MGHKKSAAPAPVVETSERIISIKGFNADFQCCPSGTPFQFDVGKTYTVEGEIKACANGFHAVDASDPFHVWDFYPLIDDDGRLTRYAEVEQAGQIDRDVSEKGTKIASAEITIRAELSLPDFVRRAVNAVVELTRGKGDDPSGDSARIGSSGHSARIGSSGHSARIGSSGYSARIGSSGDSARIGSSGDSARIGSSGDSARIGSSGHYAQIGSSGHSARIGSSGDSAQIGSSGDSAQIGSSGDYARIVASGKDSVIASAGINATVTGADGTWVSVAEFDDAGKCIGFATGRIGKDGLEPNKPYRAKGGKLVAV